MNILNRKIEKKEEISRYRHVCWLLILVFIMSLNLGCTAKKSRIMLQSTPEGADVFEARKGKLGTTNTEIVIDTPDCSVDCSRSFVFKKSGYGDVRITKNIADPEVLVHAYLEVLKTRLKVRARPANSKIKIFYEDREIAIKGKFVNNQNELEIDDEKIWDDGDSAEVDIIVSSAGYESITDSVKVTKGKDVTLDYILKELKANVEVTSEPENVDVYDRTLGYMGRTPFSFTIPMDQLVRISADSQQLEEKKAKLQLSFKKKGYKTLEAVKWITVGSDDANHIFIKLENDK
ncbi:hypothetical protein ACFL1N_10675 [Thermodesulfobacteriota bacterium]